VISKLEFEKLCKRLTAHRVSRVLRTVGSSLGLELALENPDSFLGPGSQNTADAEVFAALFGQENVDQLWNLYIEVSKVAKPSHQTPEARVTSDRKDESHHTPI
jgi:hypothetical protein